MSFPAQLCRQASWKEDGCKYRPKRVVSSLPPSLRVPSLGVMWWKSEVQTERKGVCVTSIIVNSGAPLSPHLLSVQSSVVQAGHTALEAQFGHPIVDQQEVSQLREKRMKTSPLPSFPRCAGQPVPQETNLMPSPENNLALTFLSCCCCSITAQGAWHT